MDYVEQARELTDGELQTAIAAYQAEQRRRDSIPPDKRPDPKVQKRLRQRHERLYCGNL